MKKTYIFKLEEDFKFNTNLIFSKNYWIESNGIRYATITRNGLLTIKAGYAWDGCTPKLNFFDLFIFGTPDGITNVKTGKPLTYYASLVHDVLYQFQPQIKNDVSRKQVDKIFLNIMKENNFCLSWLYYLAVRIVAWAWWNT